MEIPVFKLLQDLLWRKLGKNMPMNHKIDKPRGGVGLVEGMQEQR